MTPAMNKPKDGDKARIWCPVCQNYEPATFYEDCWHCDTCGEILVDTDLMKGYQSLE
jgi:ribosomal protein L37AE/L43A